MDLIYVGILGVILLLALLAVGVPIAFAMAFTGVIGLWIAAILTLITGYDYLRAGIRQVDRLEHRERSVGTSETRK